MNEHGSDVAACAELQRRVLQLIARNEKQPPETTLRQLQELLNEPPAVASEDLPDNLLYLAAETVQAVEIPLVVLDCDLCVLWANRAYYQFCHQDDSPIIGLPFDQIARGLWQDAALKNHLAAAAQGRPSDRIEIERSLPGIGRRNLSLQARRMAGRLQSTTCLLLTFENVTDRKDAELARRHLATIVEASDEAIFRKDVDGIVQTWNHGAERIFGYTPEEAIGRHISFIVPESRLAELEELMARLRSGQSILQHETIRRRKDGRLIDISVTITPIRDDDGRIVAGGAIGRDITDQKRLREELGYLATIVEGSNDAIVGLTIDGFIQSWNRGAELMYGYLPTEVIGRHISLIVPEEYRDELQELIEQLRRGQRIEQYETVRRRRDGTLLDVSLTFSPIFGPNGQVSSISIIARDFTQKRRYQSELELVNDSLRRRTEELERANRELEAFSYSVSHDLRAPLRTIDGFAHALQDDYAAKFDDIGRDYLRRIHDAADHMRQLIEALLRLSRVSRVDLHWMDTDISELARHVVARLRHQNPDRIIDCVIADNAFASCDPQLLEVVLDNLLGNAWKFTSERERATVEFGVMRQRGRTVYFVRDNGAGFDPTYADRLFLYFQRLHHAERFPGLGIGLPLVKRITERHGGQIWAEGRADEGATFFFTLGEASDPAEPA